MLKGGSRIEISEFASHDVKEAKALSNRQISEAQSRNADPKPQMKLNSIAKPRLPGVSQLDDKPIPTPEGSLQLTNESYSPRPIGTPSFVDQQLPMMEYLGPGKETSLRSDKPLKLNPHKLVEYWPVQAQNISDSNSSCISGKPALQRKYSNQSNYRSRELVVFREGQPLEGQLEESVQASLREKSLVQQASPQIEEGLFKEIVEDSSQIFGVEEHNLLEVAPMTFQKQDLPRGCFLFPPQEQAEPAAQSPQSDADSPAKKCKPMASRANYPAGSKPILRPSEAIRARAFGSKVHQDLGESTLGASQVYLTKQTGKTLARPMFYHNNSDEATLREKWLLRENRRLKLQLMRQEQFMEHNTLLSNRVGKLEKDLSKVRCQLAAVTRGSTSANSSRATESGKWSDARPAGLQHSFASKQLDNLLWNNSGLRSPSQQFMQGSFIRQFTNSPVHNPAFQVDNTMRLWRPQSANGTPKSTGSVRTSEEQPYYSRSYPFKPQSSAVGFVSGHPTGQTPPKAASRSNLLLGSQLAHRKSELRRLLGSYSPETRQSGLTLNDMHHLRSWDSPDALQYSCAASTKRFKKAASRHPDPRVGGGRGQLGGLLMGTNQGIDERTGPSRLSRAALGLVRRQF